MLRRWLQRADSILRVGENTLLIVLFATLLGLATAQILLRNAFFSGLFWADELVRQLVLWLAVIGAVAATRDRRHIAIELLVRSLPDLLQKLARSTVGLFAGGVSIVFAWQTWLLVKDSMEFGETILGSWPVWHFQLVLPLGFAMIALQFLIDAVSAWLQPAQ